MRRQPHRLTPLSEMLPFACGVNFEIKDIEQGFAENEG